MSFRRVFGDADQEPEENSDQEAVTQNDHFEERAGSGSHAASLRSG
jgi:hypothetical protein